MKKNTPQPARAVLAAAMTLLVLLSAGLVLPAHAELGGLPSLPVKRTDASLVRYQNPPSELLRITEYVNNAGVVFALAWSGPGQPDLALLLGVHYPQFLLWSADAASRRSGAPTPSSTLWVEIGGHSRAGYGRVVLPSVCPSPCDVSALQP